MHLVPTNLAFFPSTGPDAAARAHAPYHHPIDAYVCCRLNCLQAVRCVLIALIMRTMCLMHDPPAVSYESAILYTARTPCTAASDQLWTMQRIAR